MINSLFFIEDKRTLPTQSDWEYLLYFIKGCPFLGWYNTEPGHIVGWTEHELDVSFHCSLTKTPLCRFRIAVSTDLVNLDHHGSPILFCLYTMFIVFVRLAWPSSISILMWYNDLANSFPGTYTGPLGQVTFSSSPKHTFVIFIENPLWSWASVLSQPWNLKHR